nr:hypothetical protein [Tanacetum cinerariifolium]
MGDEHLDTISATKSDEVIKSSVEDLISILSITINRVYSFKPGLSHRYGAFKKFNTHRSHLNEWPMIINGKNIPILDVLLFHFYPPCSTQVWGKLGQASGPKTSAS